MSKGSMPLPAELPAFLVAEGVRQALAEDLGRAGDVTTQATITTEQVGEAVFVAREEGNLCGLAFAQAVFRMQNADLDFNIFISDGDRLVPGQPLARIAGNARAILSVERVALNYISHLSGIATATAHFVDQISHTKAKICCTRKTIPGLRAFEKYAVRCGGGANHRFGLDDAVLIKDNHIAVCGGISPAVDAARAYVGHLVAIEVEVDTFEQLDEALRKDVKNILLDNFLLSDLPRAVEMVAGRAFLEASGGIAIGTVRAVAETGVDYISSSKITMSAPAIDIGLDMNLGAAK